ncbi:hypothetical protein FQA39_LY15222 [Lamprigera yunnana]|nr:hypothetical protein FQA39_LY15222 [Lamprigera yunnana]
MKMSVLGDDFLEILRCLEMNCISKINNTDNVKQKWHNDLQICLKDRININKLNEESVQDIIQNIQLFQEEGQIEDDLNHQLVHSQFLENKEALLQQELINAQLKLDNLKSAELEKMINRNKAIQKNRDLCKASKVLTMTTFNYQTCNVTGFILNHNTNAEVFNLNRKYMSDNDVANHLWKLVGSASEEDWSSQILKK